MKPQQVLYFLFTVFVMLLLLMFIMPKGGIKINSQLGFTFPTLEEFFVPDTVGKKDISFILSGSQARRHFLKDSLSNQAMLVKQQDSLRRELSKIQYPANDKSVLYSIFEKLEKASSSGTAVRISHYGDSQIEGDRMTGIFRKELQKKFGGGGPGLFPVIPVAPRLWARNTYSENWKRYTGFGRRDTTVPHNSYGAMLNFSKYTTFTEDTMNDEKYHKAWFHIEASPKSYANIDVFRDITMFYGNCKSPVRVQVYNNEGELLIQDTLKPTTELSQYKLFLQDPKSSLKFTFKSYHSPEIYGFSITSGSGVTVDNIPLRGGSGTEFSNINREHLGKMLGALSTDLFILQFGGNVLPYIDSEERCYSYAKWFENQIRLLRSFVPGSKFIIIGPADMSVKQGDKFVSHPFVHVVRDALKQSAFNTGSAYWDMYEVMGGKNSMPAWVATDPPLAAPDYIHFSSRGAVKMAEIFMESFMNDYNQWKKNKPITQVVITGDGSME
jgi:lysophospholipase L1-like esterase